jgi:hypothetical protein
MVKTTPKSMTHCIAHCQVCFEHCDDYNRAEKWAVEHTNMFEHRVDVEMGIYYNTYHQP